MTSLRDTRKLLPNGEAKPAGVGQRFFGIQDSNGRGSHLRLGDVIR